jgi:hypothetical protein
VDLPQDLIWTRVGVVSKYLNFKQNLSFFYGSGDTIEDLELELLENNRGPGKETGGNAPEAEKSLLRRIEVPSLWLITDVCPLCLK